MVACSLDDLTVFAMVAREGTFTRAAAQLHVTPSAVSQTIRGLEAQLGIRLLSRTTRSVSKTEAGERLFNAVAPLLDEIQQHLLTASDYRNVPAETIRITADEVAAQWILWPRLLPVLATYPDVTLELVTDYGLTDIVADRFDAGVRIGETLAADMVAVRIGPNMRMVTVASQAYLARHPLPTCPEDLTRHRCINLRLPTHGGVHAWEFGSGDTEMRVRVSGPLIMNSAQQIVQACLDGAGIAQQPDCLVQKHLDSGALIELLPEWSEPFDGYHLYYPSRRQHTAAFKVIVDALKWEGSV